MDSNDEIEVARAVGSDDMTFWRRSHYGGGAATGALLSLLLGLGGLWLHGAAFGGALLSILLVFVLAHGRGSWTVSRLLLTGVVIAAGWGAVISFLLAVSPARELRGMLFWLMGDLGHASLPVAGSIVLLAGLLLAYTGKDFLVKEVDCWGSGGRVCRFTVVPK